jgi:hypothetical protein
MQQFALEGESQVSARRPGVGDGKLADRDIVSGRVEALDEALVPATWRRRNDDVNFKQNNVPIDVFSNASTAKELRRTALKSKDFSAVLRVWPINLNGGVG